MTGFASIMIFLGTIIHLKCCACRVGILHCLTLPIKVITTQPSPFSFQLRPPIHRIIPSIHYLLPSLNLLDIYFFVTNQIILNKSNLCL